MARATGLLSDLLTAGLARHTRSLVANGHFNGHPDLVVKGQYRNDAVASGAPDKGVEIKSTRNRTGAVDTHGARAQWMCVFVYGVDQVTEPAVDREPTKFHAIYLTRVEPSDFRKNARGDLGTRTATLDKDGMAKLRAKPVHLDFPAKVKTIE